MPAKGYKPDERIAAKSGLCSAGNLGQNRGYATIAVYCSGMDHGKNYKNRFCCGRKRTMNQDKKMRLLLVPMIFTILLYVPVMILKFIPNAYLQEMPEVLWSPFALILCTPMLIWCVLFVYIPIGVYIAMLVVYTVVSWTWILRKKKGNLMYFVVWLILCALSILMYWKWWPEYYSMINR